MKTADQCADVCKRLQKSNGHVKRTYFLKKIFFSANIYVQVKYFVHRTGHIMIL